jgi:hypothetical protein
MNIATPIDPAAETARNDPSPDRTQAHAFWSVEAAAARTERQMRMLQELAEIGMDLARAVRTQTLAPTPEAGAKPGLGNPDLVFARLARAVAQTLALQAKLEADCRKLMETSAAERAAERAEAERRAVNAQNKHRAWQKERVERVVEQTVRTKVQETRIPDYLRTMRMRFNDFDDYADSGKRSVGEIIARICRDLGLTPDWPRWAGEMWAVEEARTNAPGSPYAKPPPAPARTARPGKTASPRPPAAMGSDPP